MKFKCNNAVSVAHASNRDFFKAMQTKGIIGVQNIAAAPMVTTPNINVPLGALNYIRPGAIEVLTAPRVSDRIARPEKNGRWGDKAVTIKLKEYTGATSPDDGTASDGLQSKTNYDVTLRGVYYYQANWYATDLEEATSAAMNENYRADQAEAAMRSLAITRNDIFFNGIASGDGVGPIYGVLNEKSLAAYRTVGQNAGKTSTYWVDKTPEEIANDVVAAVNQLYVQSNGIVEDELDNGRIILAVATGSLGYLDKTNMYGKSARAMLRETYGDKLEIVAVPQFNMADSASDVFYVIFDMRDGAATILNSYIEMARAYPVFTKDSIVSQKISAATSGAVVQYPWAIVRYNGIGKTDRAGQVVTA